MSPRKVLTEEQAVFAREAYRQCLAKGLCLTKCVVEMFRQQFNLTYHYSTLSGYFKYNKPQPSDDVKNKVYEMIQNLAKDSSTKSTRPKRRKCITYQSQLKRNRQSRKPKQPSS